MHSRRVNPGDPALRSAHARAAYDRFVGTHWGFEPMRVIEIKDPDLPNYLTEMGALVELGILPAGANGRWNPKATPVPIRVPSVDGNMLTFCPKLERLYPVLTPTTQGKIAARYLAKDGPWYGLGQVAKHVGGAHQGHYPRIQVQALGPVAEVIYHTAKNGDREEQQGLEYVHHQGEEGGIQPWACVDAQGRIWLAGGDYTVPDEGITD